MNEKSALEKDMEEAMGRIKVKKPEYYIEAKNALRKKFKEDYPRTKKELSFRFLTHFGAYLDSPDENNYKSYRAYEKAKYNCELWNYYCIINDAYVESEYGNKRIWGKAINWVVENYFPEFSSGSNGIIKTM